MSTETTEAVHNSSSQLWLVAGIPALLVIAYLVYTAATRANKSSDADPAGPAVEIPNDSGGSNSESGK